MAEKKSTPPSIGMTNLYPDVMITAVPSPPRSNVIVRDDHLKSPNRVDHCGLGLALCNLLCIPPLGLVSIILIIAAYANRFGGHTKVANKLTLASVVTSCIGIVIVELASLIIAATIYG
ncbi:uncharacterized protein LOC144436721 [Glandiceps talaboti]